jgi:hypothetical protein
MPWQGLADIKTHQCKFTITGVAPALQAQQYH